MSEQTEQKKKPATISSQASKKAIGDSGQNSVAFVPRKKYFQILGVVLGLGLVIGLILATYFIWSNWHERGLILRETDQALLSLNQLSSKLSEQSANVVADQSKQSEQVEKLVSEIHDLQLRVNTQGRRIAELGSTTRSDWLLAEAVYLSRLASQRLQTERTVKNPLALLENVDLILKELDDGDLLSARRALAEDITALRLVKDVDRQGIYLELQALAKNIETLSLMDIPTQMVSQVDSTAPEESDRENFDKGFFSDIRSLVRVTQRTNPIEPVLQPAESALVKFNLRMMLEQAQMALMREEQIIFESSLSKAESYLARFFQSNVSAQTVSNRLQILRQMPVQQQLPAISRTMEAMETLLVTRQQRLTGTSLAEVESEIEAEIESEKQMKVDSQTETAQ